MTIAMPQFTTDYAAIFLAVPAGGFFLYCVAFEFNWSQIAAVIGATVLAFLLRVGTDHFVLLLPIKTTLIARNLDVVCIYGIFAGCVLGIVLKLCVSFLKNLRRSGQMHGS